nr:retrovirus-related Pol polyprotein from transposon TNT 1-94 [Tanacetum cinerariifolium]
MKIEESLNMTFDETPPPSTKSPLVDDELNEEEAIKVTKKKNLENDIEDEVLEVDEIVNNKESKNHPLDNVIGNLNQLTVRSQAQNQSNFFCFISTIEPKNVLEALKNESWIITMQDESNQFIANDVWELVPHPKSTKIIKTKWVYRNKLDKNGIVCNLARLVAQCYNQQEGIDYGKTYALVDRLESIRILLAYACVLNFKLFQIDVKSAFLNKVVCPTRKEVPITRVHHGKIVDVEENKILTQEVQTNMKTSVGIVRENVLVATGTIFWLVCVICFIVSRPPRDTILHSSLQNEWSYKGLGPDLFDNYIIRCPVKKDYEAVVKGINKFLTTPESNKEKSKSGSSSEGKGKKSPTKRTKGSLSNKDIEKMAAQLHEYCWRNPYQLAIAGVKSDKMDTRFSKVCGAAGLMMNAKEVKEFNVKDQKWMPRGRYALICNLWVLLEARLRGIGTALVEDLVERARNEGVKIIYAVVDGTKTGPLKVHLDVGFKEVARNNETDEVLLAKAV